MKIYKICLCLFLSCCWTSADLIYSNFDGTNVLTSASLVQYFGNSGNRWAVSLGPTPEGFWKLDRVELNLELISGNYNNIKVSIHTGGPIPVDLVGELSADAPITNIQANYSFSSAVPIYLNSGVHHVLVVEPDFIDGTALMWHRSPIENGGRVSEASGTTWGPYEIGFVAESTYRIFATAVPEPSTTVLMIVAGLGCWLRRQKIRAGGE